MMKCSDIRFLTSMKGFLYKPYQRESVTWRVVIQKDACTSGLLDPVQFDSVVVNEGSVWNMTSNQFLAPLSGVHYLQLSAGMCDNKPTKIELMINGSPFINLCRH